MPIHYPMAIEPGSRYPTWPWQVANARGDSGVKTEKSTLSGAAKLWKVFRRERQSKRELTILATWTSQDDSKRTHSKKHTRSSSRNLLNLTVRTGPGPILEQATKDASPSSSKTQSTAQPSVFDYTPTSSAADSTTTYEPASSSEDLAVIHPAEFQFSDYETDTEFWYDGILPDDRSFPGAYDDSSCVRPFTPVAEGLTPDLSLRDFPNPPSLLPYSQPVVHPEPRGSFRSSSLNKRSSSQRAAALRKSRSYDSQNVNPASGSGAPDAQWRGLDFHLSPCVPFLQPPKPLRFSKRASNQSQKPSGRFGHHSRTNSQRTSGGSQRKREPNRSNRDSSRQINSIHHPDSHLMHHILSTLQIQEEWEKDGDSIREHFARKPTLARSSGAGESRPRHAGDDAMTARKRLLARLQGTDWRMSDCTNTDTDADVEDLFGACTGHFRSVVSAALSLGSSIGSRGSSRSFLVGGHGSFAGLEEKVRTSVERGFGGQEEVDVLQWCDVVDLGEYLIDVDRS